MLNRFICKLVAVNYGGDFNTGKILSEEVKCSLKTKTLGLGLLICETTNRTDRSKFSKDV